MPSVQCTDRCIARVLLLIWHESPGASAMFGEPNVPGSVLSNGQSAPCRGTWGAVSSSWESGEYGGEDSWKGL
jgi:hypothetical protein